MNQAMLVDIVVLFVVGVFAWIDLKDREVASVYTTGLIVGLGIYSLLTSPLAILIAIVMGSLGFLLLEFDFFGGVADLKVLTAMGFIIPLEQIFPAIMSIMIIGVVYKVILVLTTDKKMKEEVAFVPALFISLVVILISKWLLLS